MAKSKTIKKRKAGKLINNRHRSGRKKVADKKKLVPVYIRESEIIKLGGTEEASKLATTHLCQEALLVRVVDDSELY